MFQPMDQGVITRLKWSFRQLIRQRMFGCTAKEGDRAVTLLDAIRCVEKAQRRATEKLLATVPVTREFYRECKKV